MTRTDIAGALFILNVVGLVLSIGLMWASRTVRDTPDGRARLLSALTVAAFAVTGLARRLHHPWVDQITLAAWIVAVTATAWKWSDQRRQNRAHNNT